SVRKPEMLLDLPPDEAGREGNAAGPTQSSRSPAMMLPVSARSARYPRLKRSNTEHAPLARSMKKTRGHASPQPAAGISERRALRAGWSLIARDNAPP